MSTGRFDRHDTGANPFSAQGAGADAGLGSGWDRERVSYREDADDDLSQTMVQSPHWQDTPSLPDPGPAATMVAPPEAMNPSWNQSYPPAPQPQPVYQPPVAQPYPPAPQPQPLYPAPPAAPLLNGYQNFYPYPPRTSGWATASLVMALLGIVLFLTAPLGVLFGVVGLWQISAQPQRYSGRGLAITGIILGTIYTVALILVLTWGSRF